MRANRDDFWMGILSCVILIAAGLTACATNEKKLTTAAASDATTDPSIGAVPQEPGASEGSEVSEDSEMSNVSEEPEESAAAASVQRTAEPQPASMPADGDYEGVIVDGAKVVKIRVLRDGQEVLVDTDGFLPLTWERQFVRMGNVEKGLFNVLRVDTNRDGNFNHELTAFHGIWKMDSQGNITKQ